MPFITAIVRQQGDPVALAMVLILALIGAVMALRKPHAYKLAASASALPAAAAASVAKPAAEASKASGSDFPGISVAFNMTADQFLQIDTLLIMGLGLIAFIVDTAGGVLFAKLLNLVSKKGQPEGAAAPSFLVRVLSFDLEAINASRDCEAD